MNRKGMASFETIIAIAVGALILLGISQLVRATFFPKTDSIISELMNGNQIGQNQSTDPSNNASGIQGSTGNDGNGPDGSTSSIGNGSQIDSSGSNSGGTKPGAGSTANDPNTSQGNGEVDSVGDDLAKDLVVAYANGKARELVELAKANALEEIQNNLPDDLPMGLEIDLGDLDTLDADIKGAMTKGISTVFNAISATDGLTQADREVKKLAQQGKYEEAFGKIFSGSSRFIVDTIMSTPGVSKVLEKLPPKAQLAIETALPNAIESAAQSMGERAFGSVGKKINDKLWTWYEKGYLPRKPRIPRDYNFRSGR